jgi:hypothetical protein
MSENEKADTVINAANRFAGDPGRLRRPLPDLEEAAPDKVAQLPQKEWSEEDIRAIFCPELKMLPFIVMKESNPCANAELYWHDEPSKHGHVDYKRGHDYALLTLEAIDRDRPVHRRAYAAPTYLEHIFEAMINDAIERRRKGGKGSRTNLTSSMRGFLDEITRRICDKQDPRGAA